MRDRLIELLCNVKCEGEECFGNCPYRIGQRCNKVQRLEMCSVFAIADHLLAAGVIVPPCKVGDALYGIRRSAKTGETYIEELEVAEVMYFSLRGVRPFIIACFGGKKYDNADFGKIVFLTREEAEKALEERREG